MSWRSVAGSMVCVLAAAGLGARADTVITSYEGYAGAYLQVQARQADGTWIAGGSTLEWWHGLYAGPYKMLMWGAQDTSGPNGQGSPDGVNEAIVYGWVTQAQNKATAATHWLYCMDLYEDLLSGEVTQDILNVTSAPVKSGSPAVKIGLQQAEQLGELWYLFYKDSITPNGVFDYSSLFGSEWNAVSRRTVGNALSAAIWETIFETKNLSGGYTYNVLRMDGAPVNGTNTGFQINTGLDEWGDGFTGSFAAELANLMLDYVAKNDLPEQALLKSLANAGRQDQLIEYIPEPHPYTGLVGMAVSLAGLVGLRRFCRAR